MSAFAKTDKNSVKRLPKRGAYDKATIYAIVDEALICHVGFAVEGEPFVMPTIHTRIGDTIYLHGAVANRMLSHINAGNSVCITVTHIDGIVFARSVFHHSMNYRSAVLFGTGRVVESYEERWKVFEALTEHIAKGRWAEARHPNEIEDKTTAIVAVEITSASAKQRSGPAGDEEEDYTLPVWAGVLPVRMVYGPAEKDGLLMEGVEEPGYITGYKRK